jgi:Undecaprenyl-phosphate galactose phosphotransferase WbaP
LREDSQGSTKLPTTLTKELRDKSTTTQERTVFFEEARERAWRKGVVLLVLIFSDVLSACLAWGGAFLVSSNMWEGWFLPEINLYYMVVSTVVWVGLRLISGLYPGYGLTAPEELCRQTYGTLATLAATALFAFAFQSGGKLSRLLIAISFLVLLLVTPLTRHLTKWALMKGRLWGKPVAILGAGETGGHLMQTLKEEWGLGLRPVCAFDFPLLRGGRNGHGGSSYAKRRATEVLDRDAGRVFWKEFWRDSVAYALRLAEKQDVDTVIFALPHVRRENLLTCVKMARRSFEHVIVVPNLGGVTTSAVTARDLAGTFGVEIKHNLLDVWALRMKRTLDLTVTVFGGVFIVPLLLLIALAIRVDSGGSVLYRAQRMGKDEKRFSCLKFRTMVPDAEVKLERMLEENPKLKEEYLTYHKLRHDPRITRVGHVLRKASFDELPQLWNVLRGEMSLVGPRPYLPRESEEVGVAQGEILRVPPGITGPWQVAGRSHTSFKERVKVDDDYVRNWSVWLDLILLARTVEILLFKRQAY